jgi:Ca2+-binding RTX toxin-like protein
MRHFRILIATVLVGGAAVVGGGAATGAQTYWCYGQAATIVGTPGDDVLVGRADTADVIVGLGGDDRIEGMTADDYFEHTGSSPGDRLCGGPGADRVMGGFGEDRIQGGADDDHVDGKFGYDWLTQGGGGNDRVTDCDSEYDAGVRRIFGGPGDDHLCVDTGPARMYGDGGNDVLLDYDCTTDSRLAGGGGDDRLESYHSSFEGSDCSEYGGLDSDTVVGGDGQDTALVNEGDVVTGAESVDLR